MELLGQSLKNIFMSTPKFKKRDISLILKTIFQTFLYQFSAFVVIRRMKILP